MVELKRVVRQAASGDEAAAALLFDAYHPRVFRYALGKLGHASDAEDVAAETFARVLRDIGRFRWKGGGFEAWLFRIAANLVVDRVRHRERERATDDVAGAPRGSSESDPESEVLAGEQTRKVNAWLARLPPEQREVLLLRFGAGLDTHEAGEVMRKKPNAVRQLQFRALENLREMVSEEASATWP
jgi:RNA polymerase sigma-70 factor (ECF subfamily)